MLSKANKSEYKKLPLEMRSWVIEQMIAVNNKTLPKDLAMQFFDFIEVGLKGEFGTDLETCLTESKRV